MTRPELDALLDAERPRIEAALDELLPAAGPGVRDRDPLRAAVRYALDAGGKRLRPILCVAAYRSLTTGSPAAPLYRLAAAIELVHTYSLIHDDLPSMDDDAVRRGRPATHIAHGIGPATLAGAALIPAAARAVHDAATELGLPVGARRELVLTLCRAAGGGGMVGGQLLDLEAERRTIALDELERIHRLKTGALIRAAPVMGGLAARADGPTTDALGRYGAAVGLAFQIVDDILDVTGSTTRLGKTAGRDTELEKATFPALAGLDNARARARAEVDAALGALRAAGVQSQELTALALYAVERDR